MKLDLLGDLERLIAPVRRSMRNMIARGVVQLVDDGKKLQMMQAGILAGEPADAVEHFQPYGFSSSPLPGAESVLVFPAGDRGHPIAVVTTDRRYRPVGSHPGEVVVYNNTGAKITITKDGDIVATPATGRKFIADDTGGGSAAPVATKADVAALANFVQGLFVGGTGSVAVPPGTVPQPVGTITLKAK